ncbi:Glycoside hydrolase [Teratosphaeria destructans]|uniref:Glycoside hydrolase n=1 Tax=Teratosphaeria destructans TaxID=418781 RepID=A0A9W7SYE3_9PEZI|nr:Glycoside hydrolase [Teratosphaeria destructans]
MYLLHHPNTYTPTSFTKQCPPSLPSHPTPPSPNSPTSSTPSSPPPTPPPPSTTTTPPRTSPPPPPIPTITLSITPTPTFYTTLHSRPGPHLAFLHRPWNLHRRRLPRDLTVLASHKPFDEHLTVGANLALARRLGMDLDEGRCGVVKGYKGDAERRVGSSGDSWVVGA